MKIKHMFFIMIFVFVLIISSIVTIKVFDYKKEQLKIQEKQSDYQSVNKEMPVIKIEDEVLQLHKNIPDNNSSNNKSNDGSISKNDSYVPDSDLLKKTEITKKISEVQSQISNNDSKINSFNSEIYSLEKTKNDCLDEMSKINAQIKIEEMNYLNQLIANGMGNSGIMQQAKDSYKRKLENTLKPYQDLLKNIEEDIEIAKQMVIYYTIMNDALYNEIKSLENELK